MYQFNPFFSYILLFYITIYLESIFLIVIIIIVHNMYSICTISVYIATGLTSTKGLVVIIFGNLVVANSAVKPIVPIIPM